MLRGLTLSRGLGKRVSLAILQDTRTLPLGFSKKGVGLAKEISNINAGGSNHSPASYPLGFHCSHGAAEETSEEHPIDLWKKRLKTKRVES